MGYLMNSGEVGNIGLKQLKEQREIVTNKWEKFGLLDGLAGYKKENMAQLFENQLSDMIRMQESTDSSGSNGAFETVAFPVIRRIFSKLLANDIVSVQALNLPIGKLFYINHRISVRSTGGTHNAPDGAYSNAASANPNSLTQYDTNKSLYDSYYATGYNDEGTSLFDRSKGAITVGTLTVAGTYNPGDKYLTLTLGGFSTTGQGTLIGPSGIQIDTESFLASLKVVNNADLTASGDSTANIVAGNPIPYRVKTQPYAKAIANAGSCVIELDLSYAGQGGYHAFEGGITVTGLTATYNQYRNLEQDSEMAEVTFTLDEVTVSVETRKMRAQWTPELSQDLAAFQNIDAEAELTSLLSEQMAVEIDREILRDLRRGAAWAIRWDSLGYLKQTNTYYGTKKDYNQELITHINQVSAQINKATLKGGASWIVVSPEISALLDDLEYFHVSNASPEQDKYNMGMEKVGTIQGRYQVYRDPYAPPATMLIGHKGSSILESGYIYSPYVPMVLTPVMYSPVDFKPIRGIMTRYAKKMVNNRFYGKITVDNLTTFPLSELR